MKKKLDADEDDMDDRLEKQKKKTQSDFMKQLTDIAQQAVEIPPPTPQPELVADATKPAVIISISYKSYIFQIFFFRHRKL